jgi:hypothetical protein
LLADIARGSQGTPFTCHCEASHSPVIARSEAVPAMTGAGLVAVQRCTDSGY